MAIQWGQLQNEAVTLVHQANDQGITLRLVGSAGIRLHCSGPDQVMDLLGRPAKDLDFVVPLEHRKGMRRFLEARGYVIDRDLLVAMEGTRYSFKHAETEIDIDVFVEKLRFCHKIELRNRLQRHSLTIPLEELLLQKLQIVSPTVTDTLDVGVILATHPIGSGGENPEAFDAGYIARLLARDWGFHHTATRNLARIQDAVAFGGTIDIDPEANRRVREAIGRLSAAIEAEPKSLAWKLRDKVGERKQWWQDVDDKEATY